MADQPAPPASKGKGLTRKIGPLPVWAYGVIAVGAYYWYTHYGPGASKQQQPAGGGGGLKTYAPKITEVINYRGRARGRKRKPPPPRPAGSQQPAAAEAPIIPGPGPNPGGPKRPRPKRKPPPPRPEPAPPRPEGPEQTVVATAPPPTGGPVNAETGQPVFEEWQHAHRGPQVPPPVAAYAPMTAGGIYDATSAGATVAAG